MNLWFKTDRLVKSPSASLPRTL